MSTEAPNQGAGTNPTAKKVGLGCLGVGGALLLLVIAVSMCSKPQEAGAPTTAADAAASVANAPPPPSHNWQYKEGREYGYSSELSEDDRKAGKAAADVIMFRYLGEKDGVYSISSATDGTMIASCSNPCEVVRMRALSAYGASTQRMAFNPRSIVGAALEDAMNGQMELYSGTANPHDRVEDAAELPSTPATAGDDPPANVDGDPVRN